MTRDLRRWPLLAAASTLLACAEERVDSGGPELPPLAAVRIEHDGAGDLRALGTVPFPSDLQLDAAGFVAVDGFDRVVRAGGAVLADGFADTAGFARQAGALFFVEGAVDPASLPEAATVDPEAGVVLVDVDDASPDRGRRYPVRARWLPTVGCVAAAALPGVVLAPGVRYALALTTAVRDADGAPIGASEGLRAVIALEPSQRHTPHERLYGDAVDALVDVGALSRPGDAAGVAVFTTSRSWEELFALRRRILDETPAPVAIWDPAAAAPHRVVVFGSTTSPSLGDWLGVAPRDDAGIEWPGGDDPAGVAHEFIAAVASFATEAPSFLEPGAGHFVRDAAGGYRSAGAALVPVTLVIPAGEPPPEGFPVVLHGHGLSNDRGSMLSYANELARAGFAVIGIDDVLHGTRAGLPDEVNRFPGSYEGPDGIPDTLPFPVAFFGAFGDFLATRDDFRQTILDQISLVRLVRNPALDLAPIAAVTGGRAPRLDPARVAWSGGSLGGIVGSMVASVEPDIGAAALQVPGGGFIPFVVGASAELFALIDGVARAGFDPVGAEPLDELHPLGLLLAQITEAGDPLAYVRALHQDRPDGTAPRNPHLLLTYTFDDEVLPNLATDALIRAMELPLAGPTLGVPEGVAVAEAPVRANRAGATVAAVQYAPATHGLGYDRFGVRRYEPGHPTTAATPALRFPALPAPIRVELPIREHSVQLVRFLRGAFDGTPEIVVTAPARADFDGDGVLDHDEAAAGTDPWDPASR